MRHSRRRLRLAAGVYHCWTIAPPRCVVAGVPSHGLSQGERFMLRYLSATLAVALLASVAYADDAKKTENVFAKTENGTPKIESITAIAFGPNGALLIGDGKGGQI